MTSAEEAWKLLADARERLRHAEDTRRIGIYGPAVTMAYFAAFYAAQAVVAYHREGPKTHQGVLARFHFLAVKNSDFPAEIASLIEELMAERHSADYDHAKMGTWEEAEASDSIDRARAFVNEVSDWFDRHHPLGTP